MMNEAGKGKNTSMLLINETPLQVLPSLAVAIGLPEAMILQQLHFWLQTKPHMHDGKPYVYNTYKQWQEKFPFWSWETMRRALRHLEELGVVDPENFNRNPIDKTKWYTINYEKLNALPVETMNKKGSSKNKKGSSANNKDLAKNAMNKKGTSMNQFGTSMNNPAHIDEQNLTTGRTNFNTPIPREISERSNKDLNPSPSLSSVPQPKDVGVEGGQDTTAVLFNQPARDGAKCVLAYLNQVTGCGFQDLGEIPACLAAGGTIEDCILVIDWWAQRWTQSNPRQRQYFDTNTPFAVKNFDRYRGKAQKWASEGRPAWGTDEISAAPSKAEAMVSRMVQGANTVMQEIRDARAGHAPLLPGASGDGRHV